MVDTHSVSLHTLEYSSVIKKRETLTLTTMWTDPENMMLSERSRQEDTWGVIPLMGNVQNRQIHRHKRVAPGCLGLGEEMGVTADGDGAFF